MSYLIPLNEAFEKLRRSSFRIRIEYEDEKWYWGTGFFISEDGYALTAYHNLPKAVKGASEGMIHVFYRDSQKCLSLNWRSDLSDETVDIAVLKLPNSNGIPIDFLIPAYLQSDLQPRMRYQFWAGRPVCIYGFPSRNHGAEERRVDGIIDAGLPSSLIDEYDESGNLIQVERLRIIGMRAPNLSGISGGPVFDRETECVIGVQGSAQPPMGYISWVYASELACIMSKLPEGPHRPVKMFSSHPDVRPGCESIIATAPLLTTGGPARDHRPIMDGTEYSNRILEVAERIAQNRYRDEQERLVFHKAVLLHELAYHAIIDSASDLDRRKMLGLQTVEDNNIIECIARVVKGHKDGDLESDFYNDINRVRIRFLAALLDLAQQLALDSRRVDVKALEDQDMLEEEKLDWWLRSYVTQVEIENGKVKIHYGVPSKQFDKYKKIVKRLVSGPIWETYNHLGDILWDNGVPVKYCSSEVRAFPTAIPMPPNLLKLAEEKAEDFRFGKLLDGLLGNIDVPLGDRQTELPKISPRCYTATRLPLRFSWQPVEEANEYKLVILNSKRRRFWSEVVSVRTELYYPETAPRLHIGERYMWRVDAIRGRTINSQKGVFWLIYNEDSLRNGKGIKSGDDILCLAQTYSHVGLYEDSINMYMDFVNITQDPLKRAEAYRGIAHIYLKMYNGLYEMRLLTTPGYDLLGNLLLKGAGRTADIIRNTSMD